MWRKLKTPLSSDAGWFVALASVVVFKFWLIHNEEIYGYATEYDCLWFLKSAKHWYWGAPYSWTAFIRPPAYSLFIALVHAVGIPLRIAIELFQIGAYAVLILALRRAAVPRWICLSIFAATVLHPGSFQLNNYVQADTFYTAMLVLALAALIFTLCNRGIVATICAGIALGVLWNTREESPQVLILFVTYALLALIHEKTKSDSWRAAAQKIWKPSCAIFATSMAFIVAIYSANYGAFREFAKSQTSAPSLKAAYKALRRIKPSQANHYVNITREARELAFGVSPAFARLKPFFDGELGAKWEEETFSNYGIEHEIGTAWFPWALRDVASHAGVYEEPGKARAFYRKVAGEINRARAQGRVPSRWIFLIFFDSDSFQALSNVPGSVRRLAKLFVERYQMSPDREDSALRAPQRALYDEMAGRRPALTRLGALRIVGWAFAFDDPLQTVAYDTGGGEISSGVTRFGPRADIVEKFKAQGNVPLNSEFGIPIEMRRGKIPAGNLVFITQSGRKFSGSAKDILNGAPARENGLSDGTPLTMQIFAQEFIPSSTNGAIRIENLIGKYYRIFVIVFSFAALGAILAGCIFRRRMQNKNSLNLVLVLLFMAIASRFGLFVVLDALCWTGHDSRFLFPVVPLYSTFLILIGYQAVHLLRTAPPKSSIAG